MYYHYQTDTNDYMLDKKAILHKWNEPCWFKHRSNTEWIKIGAWKPSETLYKRCTLIKTLTKEEFFAEVL